jgi:probable phosphoglycerate mutase
MSKTRLMIIRHGNTFNKGEEPRRVGLRTDLPLVESGINQAKNLGKYIQDNNLIPNYICCSELLRAKQTAKTMLEAINKDNITIHAESMFNEIDHGPDENRTEDEIILRIGKKALEDWNDFGVVPDGWTVNPRQIQQNWLEFAQDCVNHRQDKLSCVVSSGGIIKFAPIVLTEGVLPEDISSKVSTASLSLFEYKNSNWKLIFWNKKID